MSEPTGNKLVDAFLEELDLRLSDADQRQSPESKETLRRIRPTLILIAHASPSEAERCIVEFLANNAKAYRARADDRGKGPNDGPRKTKDDNDNEKRIEGGDES